MFTTKGRKENLEDKDAFRKLQEDNEVLANRVKALEEEVYWRSKLFYKAFAVSGLHGDYLEFGVFRGHTLSAAYWSAKRHYDLFVSGAWDHSTRDPERVKREITESFMSMRFFGFDSFEGLPRINGIDAEINSFEEGGYAAGQDVVMSLMQEHNVNLEQIILVPDFFEKSCTPENAQKINLRNISVVHIDSDLYSSAVTALQFCTPYFRDGSVVIFDEWFQFNGSPNHGEQRAFREWKERNPKWHTAELAREGFGRIAFVLNRK